MRLIAPRQSVRAKSTPQAHMFARNTALEAEVRLNAMHLRQTAIRAESRPRNFTAIPVNDMAIPHNRNQIPRTDNPIPRKCNAIPCNDNSIPLERKKFRLLPRSIMPILRWRRPNLPTFDEAKSRAKAPNSLNIRRFPGETGSPNKKCTTTYLGQLRRTCPFCQRSWATERMLPLSL